MIKGVIFIVVFLLFSVVSIIFFDNGSINLITLCGDGSAFGECSFIQPFYCDNGSLIENANDCGCSDLAYEKMNSCVTQYQNSPKDITLKYFLRGSEYEINYTVYGGLIDYLDKLPLTIFYREGEIPKRRDFKIKRINEPQQRELILPLVAKIQDITPNRDDQFRIAVSLVQKIPFGFSNKTDILSVGVIEHQRYPYEVLYDMEGICGEKSELLGLLLKELGYGAVLFYHSEENHESVGVLCPKEESIGNSGYCFIETTGSSIMTHDKIQYINGEILNSDPEVMLISEGNSLGEHMYEYNDAEKLIKIDEKIREIGRLNPLEIYRLKKYKNKYQLEDFYDPR